MLNQLRKAQNELKKEVVEVEAGDGALSFKLLVRIKIKKVTIDPERINLDDIAELEHWIEIAVRDGLVKAQEIAAEKMKLSWVDSAT